MFVVFFVFCGEQQMVHMGGESWRTIKDLKAPFPDLKAGHVDHLLTDMCIFFYVVFSFIVLLFIVYFSTYICFPIFLSY